MKPNPSAPIVTIRTAAPGDSAIDWSAPGAMEAVMDHRRRRTRETLAKVPVKSGEYLTHLHLRPLTRPEYRYLSALEAESFRQLEAAADIAIFRIERGPVSQDLPSREITKGVAAATEEASESIFDAIGPTGQRELGALAIARADLGDAGPFVLPPGTAPAYSPR